MSRTRKNVKAEAPRRYRVTLVKTVTFRLTSVIEVEIDDATIDWKAGKSRICAEAERLLEAERVAGVEREWSTTFAFNGENREFSIDGASIQEIDPHM